MTKHKTFEEEFGKAYGEIIRKKYALEINGKLIEKSYANIINRIIDKVTDYSDIFSSKEISSLKEALLEKRIVLGGSITESFGTSKLASLSNCFVLPNIEDSYDGIMKNDTMCVDIMKRRGGVGQDMSKIRPKGSKVNNVSKVSTGIVPFMKRYSNTTLEVSQDGRRGALMLSLNYKHRDVFDFINAKTNTTEVTGANISIRVDKDLYLSENKKLLDNVAFNMWKYAEPGILFWDNIMNNPIDSMSLAEFMTVSTNPCGEIPLNAYGSCIIAHLNLYSYVVNKFTSKATINMTLIKQDTILLTKFLNIVVDEELKKLNKIIDISEMPIEKELWTNVRNILYKGRRIGVGKTGIADFFAALNKDYKFCDAIKVVSATIAKTVLITSLQIPREAQVLKLYRNRKKFMSHPFIKRISKGIKEDTLSKIPANIGFLTVAPVGTGSIITGTSSGIEPVFEISYKRRRRAQNEDTAYVADKRGDKWVEFEVFHKPFEEWCIINNKEVSEDNIKYSPYKNNLAKDIDVYKKIKLLEVVQLYTDQSISVTHNVKRDFPLEEVKKLIKRAHEAGLKGFTMYREGSREGILISNSEKAPLAAESKRPKSLPCDIHSVKIDGKDWIVLVGLMNNKPRELFALKVKGIILRDIKGARLEEEEIDDKKIYNLKTKYFEINDLTSYYGSGNEEVFTRMLSKLLKLGVNISEIRRDFDKVKLVIGTFENVIKRVLLRYEKISKVEDECPVCSNKLTLIEGCAKCTSCGYSKC